MKKISDPHYLEKERQRVSKYYIPVSELSKEEAEKMRERSRRNKALYRQRQRMRLLNTEQSFYTEHTDYTWQ